MWHLFDNVVKGWAPFSEESAFLSVDAYSRNIFNNVCFLFIEGGTGIFGFGVLAIF